MLCCVSWRGNGWSFSQQVLCTLQFCADFTSWRSKHLLVFFSPGDDEGAHIQHDRTSSLTCTTHTGVCLSASTCFSSDSLGLLKENVMLKYTFIWLDVIFFTYLFNVKLQIGFYKIASCPTSPLNVTAGGEASRQCSTWITVKFFLFKQFSSCCFLFVWFFFYLGGIRKGNG